MIFHTVTIDGLSKTWTTDTFLNIQKRKEYILSKSNTSTSNINIAYLQAQSVDTSNNLSIRDRSTVLPENRISDLNIDNTFTGSSFAIETDSFLVTDVFTNPVGNESPVPLFYTHRPSITLLPQEIFLSIELLDNSFTNTYIFESKVDLNNGQYYNNLSNTFLLESGFYDLYYISYLVKNTSTNQLTRYIEILNNQPVFRLADINDLTEFGSIIPGRKVFILQEDINFTFSVTLPGAGTYSVRKLEEDRLRILTPPNTDTNNPWFISVYNNQFMAEVRTSSSTKAIYKYKIAEFTAQNFQPYFPYRLTQEVSHRVNNRVIKTLKTKLENNLAEELYIQVYVYDKDNNLKYAFTSNPALAGVAYTSSVIYSRTLLGDPSNSGREINDADFPVGGSSFDLKDGFIVIPLGYEIKETDRIESEYFYLETNYEINFIDLNPINNQDILRQRLVLFIRPEPLGSTYSQTLFYLLVNEDGLVLDTNYNLLEIEGSVHDGEDLQVMVEEERLWYEVDPSTISWAEANSKDFISNYTLEGNPNPTSFLILGEVFVREAIKPNQINTTDIRQRGGGIDIQNIEDSISLQPEANWYWDSGIWDGKPYPGSAAYFIEVPAQILEHAGGSFNPATVRGIVYRHTGAGIYPVIHKYNDYEPSISNTELIPSGVIVSWTQHPSDAYFNLYTSCFENGPWTLVEENIPNNMLGNQYTFPLLQNEIKYFAVIGRQGLNGPVLFSNPIDIPDPANVFNYEPLGPVDVTELSTLQHTVRIQDTDVSELNHTAEVNPTNVWGNFYFDAFLSSSATYSQGGITRKTNGFNNTMCFVCSDELTGNYKWSVLPRIDVTSAHTIFVNAFSSWAFNDNEIWLMVPLGKINTGSVTTISFIGDLNTVVYNSPQANAQGSLLVGCRINKETGEILEVKTLAQNTNTSLGSNDYFAFSSRGLLPSFEDNSFRVKIGESGSNSNTFNWGAYSTNALSGVRLNYARLDFDGNMSAETSRTFRVRSSHIAVNWSAYGVREFFPAAKEIIQSNRANYVMANSRNPTGGDITVTLDADTGGAAIVNTQATLTQEYYLIKLNNNNSIDWRVKFSQKIAAEASYDQNGRIIFFKSGNILLSTGAMNTSAQESSLVTITDAVDNISYIDSGNYRMRSFLFCFSPAGELLWERSYGTNWDINNQLANISSYIYGALEFNDSLFTISQYTTYAVTPSSAVNVVIEPGGTFETNVLAYRTDPGTKSTWTVEKRNPGNGNLETFAATLYATGATYLLIHNLCVRENRMFITAFTDGTIVYNGTPLIMSGSTIVRVEIDPEDLSFIAVTNLQTNNQPAYFSSIDTYAAPTVPTIAYNGQNIEEEEFIDFEVPSLIEE